MAGVTARAALVTLWMTAVLLVGAAIAETPVVTLDLADCRARALDNAPELAGAVAGRDASELNVRIADATILPALRGDGGYLRSSVNQHGIPDFAANNGENEYTARAVVTQPIYAGGSLAAERAKARAEAVAAQHGLESVRAQVIWSTDRAYFGALSADEQRTAAESALAVEQELLRGARVRLQNGQVAAFDVEKLELEVANATTTLRAAEADVRIARGDLGILIALPPEAFVLRTATDAPGVVAAEATLEKLIEQAVLDRPDLKRLESQLRSVEATVTSAHGARLPQVSGHAAAGYDSLNLPDRHNAGWEAGVTVSLPLWDWDGLANRERIARLEVEKARQQLEAARRGVRAEITRRYYEVKRARDRVETSATAEQLAARNADIARHSYELGLVSSLDLITAQRQAISARAESVAARYELRVSLTELDFATGKLQ